MEKELLFACVPSDIISQIYSIEIEAILLIQQRVFFNYTHAVLFAKKNTVLIFVLYTTVIH